MGVYSLAVTSIVFFIICGIVCEEYVEYEVKDPSREAGATNTITDTQEYVLNKTRIVETKQGKVEGYLKERYYYEFCGITYAVARNRFMAPEEPPSFDNVFKADLRTVLCPQFYTNDPLTAPSISEDCLILNVYVPVTNTRTDTNISTTSTSLPVMVYLHGGDFGVGGSSPLFYGPHFLVNHGVIVVSVNYRLNAFGFLNLGIKEAPGNAGLKDIRAALRWIRDNIGNFGGDKDNVTVFGHGSGGVAAVYLTLSKSCNGLFHRIISESGAPFSPKSFDINPVVTASQVAKSLEVNTLDPKELLNLYSSVDVYKLEEAIGKQMHAASVFRPSVETYLDGEPFLVDTPFDILSSGSFNAVPAIIGLNTVEGLASLMDYNTITSQVDRIRNEDFSCLDLRCFNASKKEKEKIRNILKDAYFTNITTDEAVMGGLVNLNSDFNFVGPMTLFAELYTSCPDVDVYQYIFNYIGKRNLGRILTNNTLPVTTYMDELFYIFDMERTSLEMTENDARIIAFMTNMWTNFAKYGSPTANSEDGQWLPHPYHLAISLEPEYVHPLTRDRALFWQNLYYNYGAEIGRETKTILEKNESVEEDEE